MTSLWQPWEGPRVIAVCGEAIVDLLPSGPTSYEVTPGGSPANTAVALARLGVPVTMLARLSGDDFGRLLREHLRSNGVDLSRAVEAAEPSGVAVVTRDAEGTATYRFLLDGAADWQWTDAELGPLPEPVVALHAGSIALATTPAIERMLERSRDTCTISIDPNLRPSTLEASRHALPRWLALADIIKASADDIALLHPGQDPVQVAERWADQGPALVLVTASADGAYALVAGEVVHAPAQPVQVVDTVGAGDTFNAGLLVGLHRAGLLGGRLDGLSVDDVGPALDLALRAAARSCSRAGADPPYAAELE
jgi:fructokinase